MGLIKKALNLYAADITKLVGGDLGGTQFKFYKPGSAAAARVPDSAYGFADDAAGTVFINRDYWANASRKDRGGMLVHELTHLARGDESSAGNAEQVADAVRLSITGRAGGWTPSTEARQIANKRGWLDDMAGPGMADTTKPGGRARNTFANLLSHNKVDYQNPGGAAAIPSLSPAQTANYYSQLGGLYSAYQNRLSELKQARLGAKASFRAEASGISGERNAALAASQNAAIERGMLGSSAASQEEMGIRGAAAAERQRLLAERRETIAGTRLAEGEAATDYFQGAASLEASRLADQQAMLADQLQNNLIVSGQETQMDALKAIYRAYMRDMRGGGGRDEDRPGVPTPQPQSPQELARFLGIPVEDVIAAVREGRR